MTVKCRIRHVVGDVGRVAVVAKASNMYETSVMLISEGEGESGDGVVDCDFSRGDVLLVDDD